MRRGLAAAVAAVMWTCTAEAQEVAVGTIRGTIAALDSRGDRTVSTHRDSSLDGLLIGAAIGATPGIYYLITDPNECTGMCPEEYGLIAAGAAIGWLIDRAITRKLTVFPAGDAELVALTPYATRTRKGVQVRIRF